MIRGFIAWLAKPVIVITLISWFTINPHSMLEAAKGLGIIILLMAGIAGVGHLFNWVISLPRRKKIRKLFPLASIELSDEHETFLLEDLERSIEGLEQRLMHSNSQKAYRALKRIYPLYEKLRRRDISESDIHELNVIYEEGL